MRKKNKTPLKVETIEEYFARGGKVTQLPYIPPEENAVTNKVQNSNGVSIMMTLGEGALYYSESRAKVKPRKKKVELQLNKSALPASLLKYLSPQDEDT